MFKPSRFTRPFPLARPGRAMPAALLAAVLLHGCTVDNYPVASAASANAAMAGGYRLGPGDKLRVTVFDEPTLTGEYEVGPAGAVAMPLIADVPAGNATTEDLARAISRKLAEGGYVLSPRVAVEVTRFRPFYILGEVNKPGEYAYSGQLSVLQAIAMAGGFTSRADKATVIVRRSGWDSPRKVRLADLPLLIAPGDTVQIPEAIF